MVASIHQYAEKSDFVKKLKRILFRKVEITLPAYNLFTTF